LGAGEKEIMDKFTHHLSFWVAATLFMSPTVTLGASAKDIATTRHSVASLSVCVDSSDSCRADTRDYARTLLRDLEADMWDGLEPALPDGAEEVSHVLMGLEEEDEFLGLELALPNNDETTVMAVELEREN
jgi:hypothetical protein